jgi:hypothetical protein
MSLLLLPDNACERSVGRGVAVDAELETVMPLLPLVLTMLLTAGVTFRWKDYRAGGRDRQKVMTLATAEFIRRFLIHVLPQGFHRIRHYGLLASGTRADNIARARRLLDASMAQSKTANTAASSEPEPLSHPCPCCGGRMIIIETFERGSSPRYRPAASSAVIRIDTS